MITTTDLSRLHVACRLDLIGTLEDMATARRVCPALAPYRESDEDFLAAISAYRNTPAFRRNTNAHLHLESVRKARAARLALDAT